MEAVAGPCATVTYTPLVLDKGELSLGLDSTVVVEWMGIRPFSLREVRSGLVGWVEGYEDGAVSRGRDVLQDVHVVG